MIEYVDDVAAAREARGVRMVVSGILPSPWSEAAKGVFHLARVPVLAVRWIRGEPETIEWTGVRNVPSVVHDDEPPRTAAAEIVSLADRLAQGALLPAEAEARVRTFGLLNEIAGEGGLGWCSRLAIIEAGIASEGARGFPLPIARMLAARYGQPPRHPGGIRGRVREVLALLEAELERSRARGHRYFLGERPGALDVYAATFLTALSGWTLEDCPKALPFLQKVFADLHEELGAEVPEALMEHRRAMFDGHLPWPIAI